MDDAISTKNLKKRTLNPGTNFHDQCQFSTCILISPDHIDPVDDRPDCSLQTCKSKIRTIEQKLGRIAKESKTFCTCQSRLRHARRFLRSQEYGGCDYELKIIELLMSEN